MMEPTWQTADGRVRLYLADCMDVLPTLEGVDAVVTDPPYGINAARDRKSQAHGWKDYGAPGWDVERPPVAVIQAVIGSAKHGVVWGGNYFTDILPPSDKWLIWDKCQTDFSLADCEMAWCSFRGATRRIAYSRAAALKDGKEHPTQKPIAVMEWCLQHLPKRCEYISDPFMGSGTTGVACVRKGKEFVGIERESLYFEIAKRRIQAALGMEVKGPNGLTQRRMFSEVSE